MASTSSARAPASARASPGRHPRARASRRAAAAPRASRASPPPGLAFSSDADAIDPAEASAVAGRAGDAARIGGDKDGLAIGADRQIAIAAVVARPFELRHHLVVMHDRPGNQLREEGHE